MISQETRLFVHLCRKRNAKSNQYAYQVFFGHYYALKIIYLFAFYQQLLFSMLSIEEYLTMNTFRIFIKYLALI